MLKSCFAIIIGSAALLLAASGAQANCAKPVSYTTQVEGSTVVVCPENFSQRICPEGGAMVRQDVQSGAAVTLPARCGTEQRAECFVDECVPAGTYRYGYAMPYACASSSCSTDFFATATVSASAGECAPSDGQAPTAGAKAPWGTDQTICTYGGGSKDGSSCTVAPTGETLPLSWIVLGVNGAAVLLGAAIFGARRQRR